MILAVILGMIGPWQIILILVIVLLLFGGKKIPELMKGLSESLKRTSSGDYGTSLGELKKELDLKDV